MNTILTPYIIGPASFVFGLLAAALFIKLKKAPSPEKIQEQAETLVSKSKKEAEELGGYASKKVEEIKRKGLEDAENMKHLQEKLEQSIKMKEDLVKKKEQRLEEEKQKIQEIEKAIKELQEKNKKQGTEATELLARKAGASLEELKKDLIEKNAKAYTEENKLRIKQFEDYYRENSDKLAKNILITSLQRMASPTSVEAKTEQVHILNDSVKAQLVGPKAENIKLFEELLGIDVIFNDYPNTITVSCYNLVNRRIAKLALDKLAKEKTIITEKIVRQRIEEAQEEMDKELFETGKEAVQKAKIKRPLDPELVKTIGRLQFRTSYGQNIMKHSYEVSYIAQMMAAEIGADQEIVRVAGFLHDLGKAIDQNPDIIGAHDFLTKELMEKYKFSWEETHAAWVHHDAEPAQTVEAMLVKAADAVSAARPGARQESLDKYIERIQALEKIATSYTGVEKAYAISAGREVRVFVNPEKVDDENVKKLAPEIAERIEKEVAYPGQVKVKVIRKTKNIQMTGSR